MHNAGLDNVYFSENSRIYLEEAVPRVKASLAHTLQFGKLDVYVRNTYYGKVTGADVIVQPNTHQIMSDRVITDLSVAYGFSKNISLTLGANNVFDVYPSRNLPVSSNNDQFVYTRSTSQFGMNGRYVFTRLNFNF